MSNKNSRNKQSKKNQNQNQKQKQKQTGYQESNVLSSLEYQDNSNAQA